MEIITNLPLIKTPVQERRSAHDAKVAEIYRAYRAAYPTASMSIIFQSMVALPKIPYKSTAGIRASLKRSGTI